MGWRVLDEKEERKEQCAQAGCVTTKGSDQKECLRMRCVAKRIHSLDRKPPPGPNPAID